MNIFNLRTYRIVRLLIFLLSILLFSCVPQSTSVLTTVPFQLDELFPPDVAISGWNALDQLEIFDEENLFNLVNGQAESFFAYGFEQVAVQRYENADGIRLNLEIWQLAAPKDAYGLFSVGRAGQSAEIGVQGDTDPGRRLAFWQDRYFISLNASQPVDDSILFDFANVISTALPQGGEMPALMKRLPADGLIEDSSIFFHEEISIQMELWLGGENLLTLSQETDGILARYEYNGEIFHLLLIQYPTLEQASTALDTLMASEIENVLLAQTNDALLAAVFGEMDVSQVDALLQEAIK